MKETLTRRSLIGRAGLALGGAVTLGVLNACNSEDDPAPCPAPDQCADTAAALKDFPYEKYVPADFTLDKAAVQEAAYHGYYDGGGCGHGAWSGLLGDLARAGAPFDQLPMNYGVFGAGGIAVYGSICGAALSSVLMFNSVVASAAARTNMMTALMRWYETHPFPAYTPVAVNSQETAATKVLNWGSEAAKPTVVKVAPGSHLCHASVSGWCARQDPMVNAGGTDQPDKKARCARVTADVAGQAADMINAYLASGALGARTFAAVSPATTVTHCTVCHGTAVKTMNSGAQAPASASGMACTTCHPAEGHTLPAAHSTSTSCAGCHTP